MKWLKGLVLLVVLMSMALPAVASDQNLVLASGGGYKKMVNALAKVYEAETGQKLQLIYGNMGRVTAQAKNSGAVDLVLGAQFFFERARLQFENVQELGRGRLVLAWPKGYKSSPDPVADLRSQRTKRIALPDTSKAIYGRAASQYLERTKVMPDVKDRLAIVSTVPQVYSYLSINEVDLGFLNLTHALNVRETLGGFKVLPEDKYDPIRIVVGELMNAPHAQKVQAFFKFLTSEKAQQIILANGL